MDFYEAVNETVAADPGGRGLHSRPAGLRRLAAGLRQARRVLILTGFPVRVGARTAGETDGPVGTAELAAALESVGAAVTVATDACFRAPVEAALRAAGVRARLLLLPARLEEQEAEALREALRPDYVIALERPGKAADRRFHNMRGEILDAANTDALFLSCARAGIRTVGIGDGGNELGMGALRETVARCVPHGREIAAAVPADDTLTAGVSNWWGAGLAALLSRESGKMLLFPKEKAARVLRAAVAAGAVDGCTGRAEATVDGLPLSVHQERREALRRLLTREGISE